MASLLFLGTVQAYLFENGVIMRQTVMQVDAFTDTPFSGNPAAVVVMLQPKPDAWMQAIAREMNVSETAFVHMQVSDIKLRWFTPTVEVDLCGHATLASAHVLWEMGILQKHEQARFSTLSGVLTADRVDGNWIELDFPARYQQPYYDDRGLADILGVTPVYVGHYKDDFLIEVESEEIVRSLAPDHARLKLSGARGVMVTSYATSTPGFDFVSRFFGPGSGIEEDPVTGSAHCVLGPYWQWRLGGNDFTAYQASARGGVVKVRVEGERVKLIGQAVTVMRGELLG